MSTTLYKWQIYVGDIFIGETSSFEFEDIGREDITQQRWQLAATARDLHPNRPNEYQYVLTTVE